MWPVSDFGHAPWHTEAGRQGLAEITIEYLKVGRLIIITQNSSSLHCPLCEANTLQSRFSHRESKLTANSYFRTGYTPMHELKLFLLADSSC